MNRKVEEKGGKCVCVHAHACVCERGRGREEMNGFGD